MTLSGQEDPLQSILMLQHPTVNIHYVLHIANVFHEFQDAEIGLKLYKKRKGLRKR